MALFQGISKSETYWYPTPEEHTPKKQLYRPMHNVTWYVYTYNDVENPEPNNWNLIQSAYFDHFNKTPILLF